MFPCLILWHVMSALGTFAHTPIFGKNHPKSDNDNSTNLWMLGWLAFGEGWHNNHHAEASNFRFGREKYQFDLSAHVIALVKINS
jgi:stearoyl-CoA desaturase (delta-9 desaturase)